MTEMELIDNLLNKMKIERLSQEEYRNLQYFLIKYSIRKKFDYPVCETFMEGDKALIISDTHIGSIFQNKSFVDSAYNYAIKSKINNIIHTGDLIEGSSRSWNRSEEELQNEINNAISWLPTEVKTKLLFGNHDFSVFSAWAYPWLLDMFFQSPKLDILGLGRIILNWNKVPILLNHCISDKMIHFNQTTSNELLVLEGHSHLYFANELNRVIKVPSLSDELKDSDYYNKKSLANFGYTLISNSKPYINFLQATFIDENMLLFDELRQNDNGIIYSNEKITINTLTKEMKKYNN